MRTSLIILSVLLTSAPALAAGNAVQPLPLGGEAAKIDVGISSLVSVGPAIRWAAPGPRLTPSAEDGLAVGGFLDYALDAFHFGGAVTGGAGIGRAELSAGYALGDTSLQVQIGTEWGTATFSPNPARMGLAAETPIASDLELGVTVRHQITPNLYVAGTASAAQESEAPESGNSLLFGATIGLQF